MVSAISYQGVYSEAEKSKKFAVKSSKMFENHLPAFQRAVRAVRMKKETSKPMNFIFCPDDSGWLIVAVFVLLWEKPLMETGVQKQTRFSLFKGLL